MDLELRGKIVIVTGASRGVGRVVARTLTDEGARVVAVSRSGRTDPDMTGIAIDLTDGDAADEVVEEAIRRFGRVDSVVSNFGGGDDLRLSAFEGVSDEAWYRAFTVNTMSAIRMARAALPQLRAHRGAVVNVSSIGARMPEGPLMAYNVAKAALTAFGRALATEVAPDGVRVNTVSPGPTRTGLWESPEGPGGQLAQQLGVPVEVIVAGAAAQMGMITGRMNEPHEVADVIAFLLSPRAGNITGVDYRLDGGAIRTV